MRKLLLLSVGLIVSLWQQAEAQQSANKQASIGYTLGFTNYDLPSNAAVGSWLVRRGNGDLVAAWQKDCNLAMPLDTVIGQFNQYVNGAWTFGVPTNCSTSPIFSVPVARPELVTLPGNQVMAFGHGPVAGATTATLYQSTHSAAGSWSPASVVNVAGGLNARLWPHAASSGNNVYLVASGLGIVNGVKNGISFYRSANGGTSFTETQLPGHDSLSFPSGILGDNYSISANGNTVAIVAGSFRSDWVLWKSTDYGVTFTKTTIRHFSPADITMVNSSDTVFSTNDSYHSVLVDQAGAVHCFAGFVLAPLRWQTPGYSSYTPNAGWLLSEGILYWTDNYLPGTAAQKIVTAREHRYSIPNHLNWVGNGAYLTPAVDHPYQNGLLSMPSAALDSAGNLYVVYSGVVEKTSNTGDSTGQSFRDLYLIRGTQNGASWSLPKNICYELTAGMGGATDFEEDIYPCVLKDVASDGLLHMVWQSDPEPGLSVRGDLDPITSQNELVYTSFKVDTMAYVDTVSLTQYFRLNLSAANQLGTGISSFTALPNPTSGLTTLQLSLMEASNVSFTLSNLLGQTVQLLPSAPYAPGSYALGLDLQQQPAGMYFCTLSAGGTQRTIRIIKQ